MVLAISILIFPDCIYVTYVMSSIVSLAKFLNILLPVLAALFCDSVLISLYSNSLTIQPDSFLSYTHPSIQYISYLVFYPRYTLLPLVIPPFISICVPFCVICTDAGDIKLVFDFNHYFLYYKSPVLCDFIFHNFHILITLSKML